MRRAVVMLAGLVMLSSALPASAWAQQRGDAHRRAELEARRDSLESELLSRFLEQLDRELSLTAEQRAGMDRILQSGAEQRRSLMRESGALRVRLARSLRDGTTTDAAFNSLLAEHEALRQREGDLWRAEQDELARVLSPRQRTQFVMQWVRFQEQVRTIISQQLRPSSQGGRPRQ
jgi:Spy/CpxP family protein refolding chaperone